MPKRMMRSGELRNKITIEENTSTRDQYGGAINAWTTHSVCWANIEAASGSENVSGDQISGNQSFVFTCRPDVSASRIVPEMRVFWNSRYFDIQIIQNVHEINWQLVITAIERAIK